MQDFLIKGLKINYFEKHSEKKTNKGCREACELSAMWHAARSPLGPMTPCPAQQSGSAARPSDPLSCVTTCSAVSLELSVGK